MKKIFQSVIALIVLFANTQAFGLDAPTLTISTSGLDVTASWSSVEGANGYTLYYAPNPYLGEHTIANANMGTAHDFSTTLWDGASYYVAVTASDGSSESGYSNIGLFTIENTSAEQCNSNNFDLCSTSSTCSSAGGYWWSDNTCNSAADQADVTGTWTGSWYSIYNVSGNVTVDMTQSGNSLSGSMYVTNTDCGNTTSLLTGSVSNDIATFSSAYNCLGSTATIEYTQGFVSGNRIDGTYNTYVDGDWYDRGTFYLVK